MGHQPTPRGLTRSWAEPLCPQTLPQGRSLGICKIKQTVGRKAAEARTRGPFLWVEEPARGRPERVFTPLGRGAGATRCQQSGPMTRGRQGSTGLMLSQDRAAGGAHAVPRDPRTFTVTGPGSKLSQGSHWAEAEEGWSRDCGSSRLQGVLWSTGSPQWAVKSKCEGRVAHSSPALGHAMDCSPPGSSEVGLSGQEH